MKGRGQFCYVGLKMSILFFMFSSLGALKSFDSFITVFFFFFCRIIALEHYLRNGNLHTSLKGGVSSFHKVSIRE